MEFRLMLEWHTRIETPLAAEALEMVERLRDSLRVGVSAGRRVYPGTVERLRLEWDGGGFPMAAVGRVLAAAEGSDAAAALERLEWELPAEETGDICIIKGCNITVSDPGERICHYHWARLADGELGSKPATVACANCHCGECGGAHSAANCPKDDLQTMVLEDQWPGVAAKE